MKLFVVLAILILAVLLCDRYEENLPKPVKWIFAIWKKFSHVLGIVMSFLILTVLWIVGFGTYAIIMKIVTFPKRFASSPKTYWIDVEPSTSESMKHQF